MKDQSLKISYDPEREKVNYWYQVFDLNKKLIQIEAEYDIPDQIIQLQNLIDLYKGILQDIKAVIEKRKQGTPSGHFLDLGIYKYIREGNHLKGQSYGSLTDYKDSCLKAIVAVKRKIALLHPEEKREPQKEQTPGNGLRPKIKWLRSPACLERYLTELFRDKIESPSLVVLKKDFFCSGNKQGNIEKDGKIIPTKEPPRGYFPYVFSVSRDLKLIDFVVRPFYDKLIEYVYYAPGINNDALRSAKDKFKKTIKGKEIYETLNELNKIRNYSAILTKLWQQLSV